MALFLRHSLNYYPKKIVKKKVQKFDVHYASLEDFKGNFMAFLHAKMTLLFPK